jgi:excisionase family DNA binding protein
MPVAKEQTRYVIKCVRCSRNVPTRTRGFPSKAILVICTGCGHRGRYSPSSIFPDNQIQSQGSATELATRIERFENALTVEELAKLLAVSTKKIYRCTARGELPSFRLGYSIRLDPSVVSRWLRSKEN